jgi:hypothetical protein
MVASLSANAATHIVNAAPGDVAAQFTSVVTAAGGSVAPIVLGTADDGVTSRVVAYTDGNGNPATVTIQRLNGGALYNGTYPSVTGSVFSINPNQDAGDTIPGERSGLRFIFSSPVNAFGMDIGDWATCCTTVTRDPTVVSTYGVAAEGSGLWIRFGGGAATLPANALTAADNPGYAANNEFVNFIGAIDDSGTFTTVDFWGDGWGEVLVAGGTLRVGVVPRGGIGPVGVPALGEFGLLGVVSLVGAAGALAVRRRRVSRKN